MMRNNRQFATGLQAIRSWAVTAARYTTAATLVLILAVILCWNTAKALNLYQDLFVTLSARPLAMGGTGAAIPGTHSVFYNPAGLAGVKRFSFLYNHSGRHFPGSTEGGMSEWDQLDGDTQAIVVPLPLATYAHGFTFSGEMGYDYRGHPEDGSLGYPRERYWGQEDYDALAFNAGLPVAAGVSLRRHFSSYTPPPDDTFHAPWFRHGEGMQWGILARVWPGLDYGLTEGKMNYDWIVPKSWGDEASIENTSSKAKSKRTGWALHPTGWLTLASDEASETYIFDKSNAYGLSDPVGFGVIHQGNQTRNQSHRGAELSLGNFAKIRWGDYDGNQTVGGAVNLGGLWLNYTEVEDLLPRIVGTSADFRDIHIYGFDWEF